MKLKAKYGRVWLVGFIDSCIVNCCFGDDDEVYKVWDTVRDKLEAKEPLTSEERKMVKCHLYEVSREGSPVFSERERTKMYNIASLLDRWA